MEKKVPKLYLVQFRFDIEVDAFDSDEAYDCAVEKLSAMETSDWDSCNVMELGAIEDDGE